MTDELITMAYDCELQQPGCPIVQAGLGGDTHLVAQLWEPTDWVVHLSSDMKLRRATRAQWKWIAENKQPA